MQFVNSVDAVWRCKLYEIRTPSKRSFWEIWDFVNPKKWTTTIHGQNKDSRQAGSAYDGGWALGRDEDEKGDKGRMQVLNCEDI